MRFFFFLLIILFNFQTNAKQSINIAVASNFIEPMKEIKRLFEEENLVELIIVKGSSSHLYAQIINRAPLDIFLSADQKTPKLLDENFIIPKTQFTYAIGKLVFWTSNQVSVQENFLNFFKKNKINILAIANPKFSPYGKASKEVLKNINVWEKLQKKIVLANNINQVVSFLYSRNADSGFISFSDKKKFQTRINKGLFLDIPEKLFTNIKQDAVLLSMGRKKKFSKIFLRFLRTTRVKSIIKEYGYKIEN